MLTIEVCESNGLERATIVAYRQHIDLHLVPVIDGQVLNTLREWHVACSKGELGLVFSNKIGNVETLGNITKRGFYPAQIAAGVIIKGKPKYTGFHALRHFYASWLINRKRTAGASCRRRPFKSGWAIAASHLHSTDMGTCFRSQRTTRSTRPSLQS
jgi:hypothetical protein